ncbi:IclR family transcriptional regulator [Alicyclobacillus shizuokensis]|uniref:IclR family transcriptional regulator n=1 Tax=Alicyclobacillus shizuokensis TaxID=392014 RepID=UPI00082E4B2B|nr:IclR family transcriptional regulator [Alicyclobacillus shizuokensis]MCL6627646.1 IclR family transcriptional regulator [Alicyclobacillus shizuokensis]
MRELQLNPIRVLDRAVDVLLAFTVERPQMTIDEVMEATKLPKATAYRILYTLERRGLIRYNPATARYSLGLGLLEFAGVLSATFDVSREAEDVLVELQARVAQTVLMVVREGDEMVYVFRRENAQGLKYSSLFGQRRRIPFGVVGQVMLAYLPEADRERILRQPLPAWTEKTMTDVGAIRQRIQQIRQDGWFVDVDETTMGVSGVAAPVFDANSQLAAVVGIIGPAVQFRGPVLEDAKQQLLNATREISRRLGCPGSN